MLELLTSLLISMFITYLSSILLIATEKKLGILCRDVHKPYEYFVPCIGGFPLYLGVVIGIILLYVFNFVSYNTMIIFILTISLGLILGFTDDIFDLRSRWKIVLGLLPAVPILISGYYVPRPWLPFIGHTRLHIVYPLLIALASTIYVNGANMIDTHNGVLPMFALSIILFSFILKLTVSVSIEVIAFAILLSAVLVTYLLFNVYPAKMFNGNTGAFLIGSILLFTLVFLRIEFYMVLASIPMILNGFYYISSVKGFLQKEKVNRPTYVDRGGCIHPTKNIHPITFVKLLLTLGKKPLSEKELIEVLYLVYVATPFISLVICLLLGYN